MSTGQELAVQVGIYSEIGRLREVVVHRPGRELDRLTPGNAAELLFDDVLWADRARIEHDAFVGVLQDHGVRVHRFADLLAQAFATDAGRRFAVTRVRVRISGSGRPWPGSCGRCSATPTRCCWPTT